MKVEELKMYGKALEMPKEALRKQGKITFNLIRKEFGITGMIWIMLSTRKHARRINKEYPAAVAKAKEISDVFAKELSTLGGLFSAIADRKVRKYAQEFINKLAHNVAAVSLPAIYQVNDLVKCEGNLPAHKKADSVPRTNTGPCPSRNRAHHTGTGPGRHGQ